MNTATKRQEFIAMMPFAEALGIELSMVTDKEVRGQLAWARNLCTVDAAMHGGALVTLADSVGAVCAYLNLPPGTATATIESKTNFFGAVRSGMAAARSRPLHVGRSTIVVQTEVTDADERLVGVTIQTQAIVGKLAN